MGVASMLIAQHSHGASASPASGDEPQRGSPSARRLRILGLHGYHGSGEALQRQLGNWPVALAPLAELVYVDAPSRSLGDFGWWHAVDAEADPASDDPGVGGSHRHYKGWPRTRAAIVTAFAAHGPFDGVLGFSQGAALTGLLVGLRAPVAGVTDERPLRFDFAIMIGGFASNDQELARLYDRRDAYELPSLHVLGRSDSIVPPDDSRRLAGRFRAPEVVEHAGGHVIPDSPDVIARVRSFLEARRVQGAPL